MDDNCLIMLPEHPYFDAILATPPPDNLNKKYHNRGQINYAMGIDGIFRCVNENELIEYLYGGEYDEVCGDSDILWLG